MGWMDARVGKFTVKSAYNLANGLVEENNWEGWKMVWKIKAQQRVKVFLWIMVHGKLLTNLERWRRMLTHGPDCVRCCATCH